MFALARLVHDRAAALAHPRLRQRRRIRRRPPTFAHHLRRLGYRTVLSGKMHFCGPDQLHGFEQRLTTDIYPADFGWTPDWDQPEERPSWYHNMSSVTQAGLGRAHQPARLRRRGRVRRGARDFQQGARARQAPAVARGVAHAIRTTPMRSRASFSISIATRRSTCRARRFPRSDGPAFAAPAPCLRDGRCRDDAAQIRAARRAYYGEISYVDRNVGRLLKALGRLWPARQHDRRRCSPITAKCWASAGSGTR